MVGADDEEEPRRPAFRAGAWSRGGLGSQEEIEELVRIEEENLHWRYDAEDVGGLGVWSSPTPARGLAVRDPTNF